MQADNAIVVTDEEKSIISIYSDTDDGTDDGIDKEVQVDTDPLEPPDEDFTTDEDEDYAVADQKREEREERMDRERPFWRDEEYADSINADWFRDEDGIDHWKLEGQWVTDHVEGEELHEHLL